MGAVFSSDSVNTEEVSADVAVDAEIQQTANDESQTNEKKNILFDENGRSFKEAVRWSGYIDKTFLIAQLLREAKSRHVIICAPKGFGKTLNMDMIKCFFEIETGRDVSHVPQDLEELKKFENFQAFSRYGLAPPCKILSKNDLVKEYFGRHPVVHIDFKNIRVSSIRDVKDDMNTLIHKVYLEHSYLKDFEPAKETCEKWCDNMKYRKESAAYGLEKLIEYLHVYHKRKVYLLIDEFDAPAVNALLEDKNGKEVSNINDEITQLLSAALKGNVADEHLLGSLITGASYFGGSFGFLHDGLIFGCSHDPKYMNIELYKWMCRRKGRFVNYYGLGSDELTELLERVFPGEEEKQRSVREKVVDLHNGYTCLRSVLHYIRICSTLNAFEIPEKTFWDGCTLINKMSKHLSKSTFLWHVIHLIGGGTFYQSHERSNVRLLSSVINGEQNESDIFLSFLLDQGHLSCVDTEPYHGPRLKIVNADVLVAFQEMLREFYVNICGLDLLTMKRCAEIFKNMSINTDDREFNKMLGNVHSHLKILLSKLKDQIDVKDYSNKYLIQAAVYVTMLEADYKECCVQKSISSNTYNPSITDRIGLWMLDNDFAVIWNFSCNSSKKNDLNSAKESSRQACSYILGQLCSKESRVKILDQCPNKIKNYLLIGLTVDSEYEPCMCYLLNSRDLNHCVFIHETES